MDVEHETPKPLARERGIAAAPEHERPMQHTFLDAAAGKDLRAEGEPRPERRKRRREREDLGVGSGHEQPIRIARVQGLAGVPGDQRHAHQPFGRGRSKRGFESLIQPSGGKSGRTGCFPRRPHNRQHPDPQDERRDEDSARDMRHPAIPRPARNPSDKIPAESTQHR